MSLYRDLRWADTVTVYHRVRTPDTTTGKTVTSWTRSTASGCFYGLSKRQTLSDSVLVEHDRHICRIPGSALSALERGDIICLGTVETTIADNASPEKLLTGVEHFTADVVADNRQLPGTAHWYAAEAA